MQTCPATQDILVGFQAKARVEGHSHPEVLEAAVEVTSSHQAGQVVGAVTESEEVEEKSPVLCLVACLLVHHRRVAGESSHWVVHYCRHSVATENRTENSLVMVGARAVAAAVRIRQVVLAASEVAGYAAGSHHQEHLISEVAADEACRCSIAG